MPNFPTWRPERRNRQIGTSSSGYRRPNDMRIPESWMDRHGNFSIYYERVEPAYFSEEKVGRFDLKVLYEPPGNGFSYGCSPTDVLKVLRAAAPTVPSLPDIIAFRQPTHKQRQLKPVWGRFLYFAEFGPHQGTAIVLETQELGSALRWRKRMSLDDRAKLDRLRDDGHVFNETRRSFEASLSPQTVRNTILYRTLLHELGHWIQYHSEVLNTATALDADQDVASDLYFAKPSSEREAYAHRFADELAERLRSSGVIPFDPIEFEVGASIHSR